MCITLLLQPVATKMLNVETFWIENSCDDLLEGSFTDLTDLTCCQSLTLQLTILSYGQKHVKLQDISNFISVKHCDR